MTKQRRGAQFAALTVPNYRLFVAGQGVSLVGSWTETIAQAVLILQLTHSPVLLGTAAALRYLPVLVLAPYGGVLVDRHERRRVLMTTQTLLGTTSLAFGAVVLAGAASVAAIFATAVVFGILTAVDNPARMALIPELVDRTALRSAVTLNSILANVGRGLGPVVAAALIGTIGVGWCFIVNGISFGAVILCLAMMRTSAIRSEGRVERERGQLKVGLRVARADPQILGPLLMMAIVGTLTYEFEVSLPVLAEQTLHGGPSGYAMLTTGFGIGAVLAGVLLLCRPQTGLARMVGVSVAYGVALTLVALSPNERFAETTIVLVGACSIAFLTTGNATVQLAAPPGMRGRVTALWTTAFVGSTPLGALIVGALADELGGRATLFLGAAATIAAAICGAVVLRRGSETRRSDRPNQQQSSA